MRHVLLLTLASCAHQPTTLLLSHDLSPCQLRTVHDAVRELEADGVDRWQPLQVYVPRDSAPPAGVVSVWPGQAWGTDRDGVVRAGECRASEAMRWLRVATLR